MLTGKIALVTGAAKGIGREIAKTLAEQGATVVVNYQGSRERAEQTVKEIEEKGGKAEAYQCNVADYQAVETMIGHVVNTYGRLDILVNNAGITRDNLILRVRKSLIRCLIPT